MNTTPATPKNWFEQEGQAYAQFRPQYPPQLSAFLASIAPNNNLAVDVGCGNGQLTNQLAKHFTSVVGLDPSPDQIANITPHQHIHYQVAPAENIPLPNNSASLITAAQAAHWFNLPQFYTEVRRIAVQNSILALISYGVLTLEPELNKPFKHFYHQEIAPYWPPERQLVDTGYATIDFPFKPIPIPLIEIKLDWNLQQLLGYISTWSAVRRARDEGHEHILQTFADDMAKIWGNPNITHLISWPINMRVGIIE